MPDRYGENEQIPADSATDAPLADWERELIHASAVARCGLCDDDGMRGMLACDHIDHAAAAKRGMDLIRPILERKQNQRHRQSGPASTQADENRSSDSEYRA